MITSAGFSLQVADVDRLGEANGVTDWRDRRVVVREGLPGAQRFKTAVHELAHIQLHEPTSEGRPHCRGIVEVEAESVAYMVCAALGVDSAGYSLPYVASWSGGDLEKVAATADRVIRCARRLLNDLEADREVGRDRSSPEIATRQPPEPRQAGTVLPDPAESAPANDGHRELQEALRCTVAFYEGRLNHKDGADARTFLDQRGFTADTASHWQLGYAPATWDSLVKALRSQGVADEAMLEAGLAGRARTGRLYDRMRGRVVFPIFDREGSPRGFAGRLITGEGPKYLNSPETPLYKKSALLYGLHLATPAISEAGQAVVVEGYTDAIAAHQAGITNTVATGGTALTPQHIEVLRPVASTLTLTFDGDQAGLLAAERVAELPRSVVEGLSLQLARLPAGSDPSSLLAGGRSDLLQTALGSSIPLVHHQINQIVAKFALDEPEALIRAIYATRSVLACIEGPDDRTRAISHLAARVGRSPDMIESALWASPSRREGRWAER
ncbi:MAG: DNA primase [Chloroflexota bacterium]